MNFDGMGFSPTGTWTFSVEGDHVGTGWISIFDDGRAFQSVRFDGQNAGRPVEWRLLVEAESAETLRVHLADGGSKAWVIKCAVKGDSLSIELGGQTTMCMRALPEVVPSWFTGSQERALATWPM